MAMRAFGPSPTLEELEQLARQAMETLPEPFASHLPGVLLQVEEFADPETLAAMEIEEPFDLTGLYEGIPVGEKSVEMSGAMPDRIRLFRRPILDEWAEGGDSLETLVRHILIHEVGHHFGLSDADMHAIEESS
jgi:predicted Zn-dependent protease with MMP-like domain